MQHRKSQFKRLTFTIASLAVLAFVTTAMAAPGDMSLKNRIKIRKKSYVIHNQMEESEEYTLEKIEVLGRKRRGLILDIRKFLREASDRDQKGELNLRLGSLYLEDYYSKLAKAQQLYEQETKEFTENGKQAKKPILDNSDAVASLNKARVIYKDLLQRYPNHHRRDEILFSLGVCSLDKGLDKEGMTLFKILTDQYPKSKYVNDASVQLADHHFDRNQFSIAEPYYDRIIATKNHPLIGYARYKKAWCAYNTGRVRQALEQFKWVIANEKETGSPLKIQTEALKDITLPFVDLKLLAESVKFFRNIGDPHFRRSMETMALLYVEAADHARSINLWATLLAHDPNHAKNPLYDISIIDALLLKGQPGKAVTRLFSRLATYHENSSWYELNASSPKIIAEASEKFEGLARKLAFQFHAEAQKTKNDATYELAKELYSKYLEFFPITPYSSQLRFFLAEILYRQQAYGKAAEHYIRAHQETKDPALRLDAIRFALSSLDRQLNSQRKIQGLGEISSKTSAKLKDDAPLELTPYSEVENRFIEIANLYLKAYPSNKDAPDVLFEISYLQYLHHDFVVAYKHFWVFISKYSSHPASYSSAHFILDILNRRKDYPKLIAACQRLLETRAMSGVHFRAEVGQILRHAELKRIALLEEKGQYKEAGDDYIEYTKAYGPQDEGLFEKALFNAAINYTKADRLGLAAETQEKFLRRFPKSALRENMLLQVAKTYELLANFERAALYYEQFSSQFPKNQQAKNALRLAGLYFWGAGQSKRAETVMQSYLNIHASDPDHMLVENDLLELYESHGNLGKQIAFYRRAKESKTLSRPQLASMMVKLIELEFERTGKRSNALMDEALKAVDTRTKTSTQTGATPHAIAKVMLWAIGKKEDEFYRLSLSRATRNVEATLQRKLDLLKELEQEYLHLGISGGDEWVLASLYKTASIYRHLAEAITQAPVPAELTAEQVELYRNEVGKTMVEPFTAKALAFIVQCLDKAQELNALTVWTPRCYGVASEMDPARYPKVRTLYLPPMRIALMLPAKDARTKRGDFEEYALPYYSTDLFRMSAQSSAQSSDRSLAHEKLLLNLDRTSPDGFEVLPFSYQSIADERRTKLSKMAEDEKPASAKQFPTFAYLNTLRIVDPKSAILLIINAIQKDPHEIALHNLLALAYMEIGNYPAAKVCWLALNARGVKDASILNNLGVLALKLGKESQAIDHFQKASLEDSPKEALSNLAFISLKYRNGFEAKGFFERAMSFGKEDNALQVGFAVAMVQNREMDGARDDLTRLIRKYKGDPYARISLAYFIIDAEKELELARQILTEYMDEHALENDLAFRQAMQEAKQWLPMNTRDLPSVNP